MQFGRTHYTLNQVKYCQCDDNDSDDDDDNKGGTAMKADNWNSNEMNLQSSRFEERAGERQQK
jgi:hypothetical protein